MRRIPAARATAAITIAGPAQTRRHPFDKEAIPMRPICRPLAASALATLLAACSGSDDDAPAPLADDAASQGVPIEAPDPDDAPDLPAAPGEPVDALPSAGPEEPAASADPAQPAGPVAAADPVAAEEPVGSVVSETPVGPVEAEGPVDPAEPAAADEPATPGEVPEDVDGAAEPEGAADPVASEEPAAANEPAAAADPAESGEPVEPAASENPFESVEEDEPAAGPAPSEEPADPAGSAEPAEPATAEAPVDAPEPEAPASPAEPVVPAGPVADAGGTGEVTFSGTEENDCEERVLGIYVRTLSEVCSLDGPSRTDGGRTDDAPSAPTGLTALLVADDWVQLDWIPSSDDGAVVAYEISRDGQPIATVEDPATVQGDARPRIEAQRYWRTTTYIDCDYTRFFCEGGRPQPGTDHAYTVVAIDGAGNRSAASAPLTVRTNAVDGSAGPPDPASEGYTLAFGDEFDGDALDPETWATNRAFDQFDDEGRAINDEQQFFVDSTGSDFGFPYDPFTVEGGTLSITAARTADVAGLDAIDDRTGRPFRDAVQGQPFLSGAISSRDRFEGVRYGYVEVRARVPSGNGLLSTFFLFQPSGNQYEIDILEYLGREPNSTTQSYHYRDGFRFATNGITDAAGDPIDVDTGFNGVAHASPTMFFEAGTDLSDGFRTYSVLWEPELVVYYVDGQEVRRITGPRVSDQPMDIVAQLVVGSPSFAGPATGTEFPVAYEIDYIRAWQR